MQGDGQSTMLAFFRERFPASKLRSTSNFVQYALVDAFTDETFKGNPAGVCLLPAWPETRQLQQIASELNVNMTAFLVTRKDSCNGVKRENAFSIRWFTPLLEVDLCGHATLASSYFLFGSGIVAGELIQFHPAKGEVLLARRVEKPSKDEFLVELAFPILPSYEYDFELAMLSSTLRNAVAVSVHKTTANDLLIELSSGDDVKLLDPFFDEIRNCSFRGLIVTGQTSSVSPSYDFVSRFFAPKVGIDEDPVCGQAHCALAAFWAKKLNKNDLVAFQASRRGGTLLLRVDFEADRVFLQGEATLVMCGVLFL